MPKPSTVTLGSRKYAATNLERGNYNIRHRQFPKQTPWYSEIYTHTLYSYCKIWMGNVATS